MLEETVEALKEVETKTSGAGPAGEAQAIAELDRQAVELEKKATELRKKIEALKGEGVAKTSSSTGSH